MRSASQIVWACTEVPVNAGNDLNEELSVSSVLVMEQGSINQALIRQGRAGIS